MTDETPITPTSETKPKRVRVNMWLNQPTHRALKVWCTQRGVTMQSGLERMIDAAFAKKLAAPTDGES
jgi:hypothetical protein